MNAVSYLLSAVSEHFMEGNQWEQFLQCTGYDRLDLLVSSEENRQKNKTWRSLISSLSYCSLVSGPEKGKEQVPHRTLENIIISCLEYALFRK